MGNNQTNLRKIIAYSSINHIGWILTIIIFIESIWIYYFIIYSIITFNITIIFKIFNIYHLKQLLTTINNNPIIKFSFIVNFLSLGGLPPFIGFFPKWLTIQTLIENQFYSLSLLIVIITLITLYFYIRITYRTILLQINEIIFIKQQNYPKFFIITINIIALIGLIFSTLIFNIK